MPHILSLPLHKRDFDGCCSASATLSLSPSFLTFLLSNPLILFLLNSIDISEKAKSKRSSRKDAEPSKPKSPPSSGRSKASTTSTSSSGGSSNVSGSGSGFDANKLSAGEKTPNEWPKTDLRSPANEEDWSSPKVKRSNRSGIPAAMSDDGGPEARSRSKRKKTSGVPPLATSASRSRASLHGEAGARLIAQAAQLSNKASADWDTAAGSSGEEEFPIIDDKRLFGMGGSHSNMLVSSMSSRTNAASAEGNDSTSDRSPVISGASHHSARAFSSTSGSNTAYGNVGMSGQSAFSSFERTTQTVQPTQVPVAAFSRNASQIAPQMPIARPAVKSLPSPLVALLEQIKTLENDVRHEFASLSGRQFSTLLELIGRMKTTLDPPLADTSAPQSKGIRSHSSFTPFASPSPLLPVVPSIAVHAPVASNSANSLVTASSGGSVIISSSNNTSVASVASPSAIHPGVLVPSSSSPASNIGSSAFASGTGFGSNTTQSSAVTTVLPQISSKPYLRLGRQMQDAGMQTEPRATSQLPLATIRGAPARQGVPARYASREESKRSKSHSEAKRGNAKLTHANSAFAWQSTSIVAAKVTARPSPNIRSGSSGTLALHTGVDRETSLNSGVDFYKPPVIPERSASSSAFASHSSSSHTFSRSSGSSSKLVNNDSISAVHSSSALALVAESGSNSSTGSLGIPLPIMSSSNVALEVPSGFAIETSSQDSSNSSTGSGLPSRSISNPGNAPWHSHFDLLRSLDESEEELRRDTKGLAISPSAALIMGGAPISRLAPPPHLAAAALRLMQSEGNRSTESPDAPTGAKEVDDDPALNSGGSPADSSHTPSPRRAWVSASKRSSSAAQVSDSSSAELRVGSRYTTHTMPVHRDFSGHSMDDNRSEAEESSESQHSTPVRDQGPIISLPPPHTHQKRSSDPELQVPVSVRANPASTASSVIADPETSKSEARKKKKKKESTSSSSSSEYQQQKQQPLFTSSRSAFAPKRTSDPLRESSTAAD